jgi:PspA-Associated protein
VIVRISGEGQFRLPDKTAAHLNQLDNEAVAAVEAGDQAKFSELWKQMLDLVQSEECEPVPDDELVESDVILPPRDISFDEAAAEFTGDGLIPD